MLPTKLLIFGSPKTGTPVMLAAPSIEESRLALATKGLRIAIWMRKNATIAAILERMLFSLFVGL